MTTPTEAERAKARELLNREYGKDHPAARHSFTITFRTTTYEHQVKELAQALASARVEALEKVLDILGHDPEESRLGQAALVRVIGKVLALRDNKEPPPVAKVVELFDALRSAKKTRKR